MSPLFVNVYHPSAAQPSPAFLLEDCPAGDESVELTDIDAEDARVLGMLVAIESFRVSRALGALFDAAYRRGMRDARLRLRTA
jgi:hypothetical protein